LFRPGNAAPQANNLSLLRKISRFVKRYVPGLRLKVRIDSAGYNHRIMRYCDRQGHHISSCRFIPRNILATNPDSNIWEKGSYLFIFRQNFTKQKKVSKP
jgi:hypothetical protein